MLLYPFSEKRLWQLEFEEGYFRTLKGYRDVNVITYSEYIEARLITDDESLRQADLRMARIIERINPDIIVSLFSSMHDFIIHYEDGALLDRVNIFAPSVPSRTEQYSKLPNLHMIESSVVTAMRETVQDIERLIPELSELIVISGAGVEDLVYFSIIQGILGSVEHDYPVTHLNGLSLEEITAGLSDLPDNCAIMYLPTNQDKYGKSYYEEKFFPELAASADAPIFTFFDSPLGDGITGGRVTSAASYGQQTVEMIIQQLLPEPSTQSISKGEVRGLYDWRQLQKWKISEDRLTEDSLVLYHPETFFYKYKRQLILVSLFILIETVLIVMLVLNLIQRRLAEQLLLDSEDLLLRSENTARLGGWDFHPQTNKLSYTKGLLRIFGLQETDTTITDDFEDMIVPEYHDLWRNSIEKVIETGENTQIEFRIIPRNSEELWVKLNCIAVKIGDQVVRISGTIQDISERKAYEQEIKDSLRQKDILLQEVHHRVKNNLAIITSLLSIQSEYIKNSEAKKILLDSSSRINTLALVYEQIYISDYIETINFSEYVKQLVGDLLNHIPPNIHPISIQYNISNMNINIDRMIPIGLIINEAVYNSLKHAFAGIEKPEISISADYLIEDKKYSIQIKDNGCGITDIEAAGQGTTLGFLLIKTLTEQINGELEIKNNNGLDITITFIIPVL